MTLIQSIRTSLSAVGRKFADQVIYYRSLSSAPNAQPRTFTAWTLVPYSRAVEFSESQQRDETTGVWYRLETCELRVPYEANVSLSIRDQLRIGPSAGVGVDEIVWSMKHQKMSAAGAVQAYDLERRTPMMTNPRPGGV